MTTTVPTVIQVNNETFLNQIWDMTPKVLFIAVDALLLFNRVYVSRGKL